jgi:hypothetical protein
MNSTHGAGLFLLATLMFLTGLSPLAEAQSESFRLKRSKKETVPINVQLMAGYNGMSDPAEFYQDRFENTNLTAIGGFAVGLQGMIEIDTMFAPVWVGADVTYFRMYKRALYDDPNVHYVGEPDMRVDAIEALWGLGINGFVAFGPVARMTLLVGGGMQYHDAVIDKKLSLVGTLTEDRIIPAGMAALNIILLAYDHGSIDAQFRGIKGFGEYGSIHFQSMLAFTFSF